MRSVIVLQARTNSSRLPGKVLLPLGGMPIAVLAAKRAANTSREVIIATSMERSDDGLAEIVQSYGIRCYRGSLENTLDRFVSALKEFDGSTLVFRLTADNVFPDGSLISDLETEFLKNNLSYLGCNGTQSGLPYGTSVEVTRLADLREALEESTCKFDREHVTPFVIRKHGYKCSDKFKFLNKGHFRCTIDCLDDYLVLQDVFHDVHDPVNISFLELIRKLDSVPYQPISPRPVPKLVFGTAQLGGNYGIANKTGQPSVSTSMELIKTAISNGVCSIDSARAYGESESIIGNLLKAGWAGRARVITKLSPILDCPTSAPASVVNAFVDASVFESAASLYTQKIDVLLLHRASHLFDWEGQVWKRLIQLQGNGYICDLGVSVQNPEELSWALDTPEVRYIQMPLNLLDWRWDVSIPKIMSAKASRDITIHVRSVFLQGLLQSYNVEHWRKANVENSTEIIAWLNDCVKKFERISISDLSLAFVNSLDWVDGIVIGMENKEQLEENISLFNNPQFSCSDLSEMRQNRPKLGEKTLNPSLWKK